jgi:N-acetylglucosamine-6-phosphate deacetylase
MIVLSGADIVLPDGVQSPGTLVLEGDRIADIFAGVRPAAAGAELFHLENHFLVPGFIDVHVHGVDGVDTLDGPDAIAGIARRLPKYGVTAFCPTTVACSPQTLRQTLSGVRELRTLSSSPGARVLPAHLESNFIKPEFRGAQPLECLRKPPPLGTSGSSAGSSAEARSAKVEGRSAKPDAAYDGADVLAEIDRAGADVGIVTLAPELDGALELIRYLVAKGKRVSLGHSGATFEESLAGISAGARHATHLFNRMPALAHRDPGLVGAVLTRDEIAAELICDGVHVHPAMIQLAIGAKHCERLMAITDGTAAAGLPDGSVASLGGRRITVRHSAAYLDDGTLAGSVATMDRVFKFLVTDVKLSLKDAALLCATTPATELGLQDLGAIRKNAVADLVVLDRQFNVKQTYIAGTLIHSTL